MKTFEWDHSFDTHVGDVDAQHHKLVELINALGEASTGRANVSSEELQKLHGELLDYAEYHFAEEQQLMCRMGVDSRHRAGHEREHEEFRRYIGALTSRSRLSREEEQRLLLYLVHWLTYHILGADQTMARQISGISAGLSAGEAYDREVQSQHQGLQLLLRSVSALFQVLSERNRELTVLTESLEQKVAERTEALSIANAELKQLITRVEHMAMTDSLTGLPNRRYALTRLSTAWAGWLRYQGRGLSCLVIDADGFKQVNDKYGHGAGDAVLVALANALRAVVRASDEVCRMGGDEFLVLCPETPLDGALHVGERLRAAVERLRVEFEGGVWCGSVSVGASVADRRMTVVEDLLRDADSALYVAKRRGRNCVTTSQSETRTG